jgi:uncharacterized protein
MTVAYFDSSALVKLVVEEAGSEITAELWDGADMVASSRVAHPEVRAALAAARRDGRLGATAYRQATTAWREFHMSMRLVEVTSQVEHRAGDLAEQHGLSGIDAVHLASALTLAAMPVIVATWDARLHRAAQSAGLSTLPAHL